MKRSRIRTRINFCLLIQYPEFLVIDLMIKDYTKPQTDDNYVFMEFNTAPALRLYYGMRTGKPFDMTAKLVDMLDAWSKKK